MAKHKGSKDPLARKQGKGPMRYKIVIKGVVRGEIFFNMVPSLGEVYKALGGWEALEGRSVSSFRIEPGRVLVVCAGETPAQRSIFS